MQQYSAALLTGYSGKTGKYSWIDRISFFDDRQAAISHAKGAFFFDDPGTKAVVSYRPDGSVAMVDAEIVWTESGSDVGKKISEIADI